MAIENKNMLGVNATPTRFRVLHISDVHFGSHFDRSVWEYIEGLVKRERPNAIACTGDIVDHGGLFMLALASKQFSALKKESGVDFRLYCVPGNHDRGLWGNIKVAPFSKNFDAVFGPAAIDLPDEIPTYLAYCEWSALRRWACRLWWTVGLYLGRIGWAFRGAFGLVSEKATPLIPDKELHGAVFIHLDSNDQAWLASGNVDMRQVTRLKAQMLNLRDQGGDMAYAPRIALIHHHPLPIPDAKISEGLTSFEPFLVLRNAGAVLRELNRCDVDLILHGHKHYSTFARLGYSLEHLEEGEMAVLAAGSAGVTHSERGRNSVNFVDVFRSGRMAYTTIFFGGGGGQSVTELFRNTRYVHGMEMHKARMFRRAAERQGQWALYIRHAVDVDAGGVAIVRHEVGEHRFERDQDGQLLPVHIAVSMGRVPPTTLRLLEQSVRSGYSLQNAPVNPENDIHCFIDLSQPLAVASAACSYGYEYMSFNTYAVTEWEAQEAWQRDVTETRKRGRSAGLDSTQIVVRVPVRQLTLTLSLPNNLQSPEPQVRVHRWSTYPAVPMDDQLHFFEDGNGRWEYDVDSTQHEGGRLSRKGENQWELVISNPLVAHSYEIRWRVRDLTENDKDRHDAVLRKGKANAYRHLVLSLLEDQPARGFMDGWAEEMLRLIFRPALVAPIGESEHLEVAMFGYDDERHQLRLAFSSARDRVNVQSRDFAVPLNEGVVGAAFKRTAVVCYIDPALSGSLDDAAYLYDKVDSSPDKETKWKYVVAFPIFALQDPSNLGAEALEKWSPAATVGVLTIASTSPDSGLLRLMREVASAARATQPAVTDEAVKDPATTEQASLPFADEIVDEAQLTIEESDTEVLTAQSKSEPKLSLHGMWAVAHLLLYALEQRVTAGKVGPHASAQVDPAKAGTEPNEEIKLLSQMMENRT